MNVTRDIVVEINRACKVIKGKPIISDLSLSLQRGKVYGLIGQEGAGKTSLLKMMLGVDLPSSGSIRVFDWDPHNAADGTCIRKHTGYVDQGTKFYPSLTVKQVVQFSKSLYADWDDDVFAEDADRLGVSLGAKVSTLSTIEKVKLAICIALSHQPDLLLLDDPTSGLDPLARREFHQAIDDLLKNEKMTTLFATHEIEDVERIADTVFVIDAGRLVEQYQVESLKERYRRVSLIFERFPNGDLTIPEAKYITKGAREWIAVFEDLNQAEIEAIISTLPIKDYVFLDVSLEDLFLELLLKKGS